MQKPGAPLGPRLARAFRGRGGSCACAACGCALLVSHSYCQLMQAQGCMLSPMWLGLPPSLTQSNIVWLCCSACFYCECSSSLADTERLACFHAQLYHHHNLAGTCDMCNASIAMYIKCTCNSQDMNASLSRSLCLSLHRMTQETLRRVACIINTNPSAAQDSRAKMHAMS